MIADVSLQLWSLSICDSNLFIALIFSYYYYIQSLQ